jgi:hypothetical protein
MFKTCTSCQASLPATLEFFGKKDAAGRLASRCKPCKSAAVLKRYHEREGAKVAANKAKMQWARENRERTREISRACRARNLAKALERERAARAKARSTPEGRLRIGMRRRLTDLRRRGLDPSITVDQVVGCTWAEYVAYIETKLRPGMSWENYGSWQIDHIEPIARANLSDPGEARRILHYSNTEPLWAHENQRKSHRQPQQRETP